MVTALCAWMYCILWKDACVTGALWRLLQPRLTGKGSYVVTRRTRKVISSDTLIMDVVVGGRWSRRCLPPAGWSSCHSCANLMIQSRAGRRGGIRIRSGCVDAELCGTQPVVLGASNISDGLAVSLRSSRTNCCRTAIICALHNCVLARCKTDATATGVTGVKYYYLLTIYSICQ